MSLASRSVSSFRDRPPIWSRAVVTLAWWHRWLGIMVCLLFAMWFATGAVMIYVPFPSLSEQQRIALSEPIPLSTLALTPSEALIAAGRGDIRRLRLVGMLGSARYLVELTDGTTLAVAARSGPANALDPQQAGRLALAYGVSTKAVPMMVGHDQWTVHQRFDGSRPFYRVDADDRAGTSIYVSVHTGEVLQRTTSFERSWNWVGSVLHWIYPTILRRHFHAWDQTVWWLSLVCLVTAATGFVLGILRTFSLRRKHRGGISPFRGWMKWHHLLGLTTGLVLLTWIFSGWLSMDHGRLFSLDRPGESEAQQFHGASLQEAVHGITLDQIGTLAGARELEFIALAGKPYVILRGIDSGTGASGVQVVPVKQLTDASARTSQLPDGLLLAAARSAWAGAGVIGMERVSREDAYTQLRNDRLPLSTVRFKLGDDAKTWVHVDASSGRILNTMDLSRRNYRWLYNGLHTFDFPLLNRAGLLWQALMLVALALGFTLSVSAVVLAIHRLRKGRSR